MKHQLLLIILPAFAFITANAITVEEIIKKMETVEKVPHSISLAKQVVITASGNKREFQIRGYALNGMEKQLQIYEKPARVRGEKILMLNDGDDIWAYSPRTMRVRHLATHMKKAKVMGSDFSYQDFSAGDYFERFKITLAGEEKAQDVKCYKCIMVPTPKGPTYKKMIAWIGKADYVVRKIDYYDDEGLLKRLLITEVKTIDNRPTPWRMVMKNIRDGGETQVETLQMDYTAKPDPGLFTEKGLKKTLK